MVTMGGFASAAPKPALRAAVLAARAALEPAERAAADAARTAAVLAAVKDAAGAGCITSYLSAGSEPDTSPLLRALAAAGVTVLLPRLRPGGALEWVRDDSGRRGAAVRGVPTPLGVAVDPGEAQLWLVPALAVDRRGTRLGRGGGSYDRCLPPDRPIIALLHAGELVEVLPAEPHDRPVTHAALPTGVVVL